jgi:hypothetical protein
MSRVVSRTIPFRIVRAAPAVPDSALLVAALYRLMRFILAMTAAALAAAGPAGAVIGGTVDPNVPGSPWAGTGSVVVEGGGAYGGVLIGPRLVLTAAHVVAGAAPQRLSFRLNLGEEHPRSMRVAAVYPHPGYRGTRNGSVGPNDIALLVLATEAPPWVPVYPLYLGPLAAGMPLELVGYGASREPDGTTVAASPAVKRVGRAVVRELVVNTPGGRPEVYVFRADAKEGGAMLATGDSGGPAFVRVGPGAAPFVAGINTFTFAGGRGGAQGGGGSIASAYAGWIEAITALAAQSRPCCAPRVP